MPNKSLLRLQSLLPQRTLTATAMPALPDRIRQLIVEREDDSERLIGWAQLVLVAIFAALYNLSPRPRDAGMIAPVPVALVTYAAFTLARLALAYWRRLPGPVLVLSIFADMALLFGLIWAFHYEYGQPAAFSLKVPTFIYVFVFIALRALRFDYRYVLTAGLFGAGGWLVLVAATLAADGTAAVTHSFADYLTSNRILLGAEFDKVIAILLVAGLLAIAMRRAQSLLVTATREEVGGREIRRFLSDGVAAQIAGAEQQIEAGYAIERDAAVLMLDIRGFTRLSQTLAARDTVRILTEFHSTIVPVVARHHGVIDKFLGDGVMITFGAVTASSTAAADALRALDEILVAATLWSEANANSDGPLPGSQALQVNGAIVAGPVVFAALGNGERLELTVIGDAVNLAAKLEKHNKALGCRALTTAATWEQALTQDYQPPGGHRTIAAAKVPAVATPTDLVIVA
jgi:adenylate cyclase